MVQEIKKQYFTHDLNSIYDDDDAPPYVDLQDVEGKRSSINPIFGTKSIKSNNWT